MQANNEAKKSSVNWAAILGGLGVVTLGVGLSDVGGDMVSGMCRGLGAVFLFLATTAWVITHGISPEA